MQLAQYFDAEIQDHKHVTDRVFEQCRNDFAKSLTLWVETIQNGGKILFFGNGGSAGDAQHLATELAVRFKDDRAPIAALALTTDTSSLTAIGNDYGFDHLFARQIDALGRPGDLAVGISTSGRSKNVNLGLEMARKKGLIASGFSGRDGGAMPDLADPLIIVPSDVTARIQEMHIMLGQMLCGALEKELGLV